MKKPVVIGLAVVVLAAVVAGGYWVVSKPPG
ncbi:Uncharacterised protein [Escherichia coli]|nr:Uncharacterised protein [Escherichia coli]